MFSVLNISCFFIGIEGSHLSEKVREAISSNFAPLSSRMYGVVLKHDEQVVFRNFKHVFLTFPWTIRFSVGSDGKTSFSRSRSVVSDAGIMDILFILTRHVGCYFSSDLLKHRISRGFWRCWGVKKSSGWFKGVISTEFHVNGTHGAELLPKNYKVDTTLKATTTLMWAQEVVRSFFHCFFPYTLLDE